MIRESLKRHDLADAKAIGRRICAARKSRRWTQKALGEIVGVTGQSVWYWETGRALPRTFGMLIRLCHALRRSADWLILGTPRRGTLWRTNSS